jgi:hypothetical protein
MMENSSQLNSKYRTLPCFVCLTDDAEKKYQQSGSCSHFDPAFQGGVPDPRVTIAGRRDERALGIRNCFGDFTASRHPACQVYWGPFCLGFRSACSAVHGAYVRLTKRVLIEDRCPIHAAEADMSFVVNMT